MKYLKTYETLYYYKPAPKIKIGEYGIASNVDFNDTTMSQSDILLILSYVKTHIGERVKNKKSTTDAKMLTLKYYDVNIKILNSIDDTFDVNFSDKIAYIEFYFNEVEVWSDNKEELELIIKANKYNI
jgi:hypothetical protein